MLDVDYFKAINDNYGHAAGDAVLQRLVEVCASQMRGGDVFARFGGEEFVIALDHTDLQAGVLAAERLRGERLRQQIGAAVTPDLAVTISCGVAQYHPEELGIDDALRRADHALYAAKRMGRNRVMPSLDSLDRCGTTRSGGGRPVLAHEEHRVAEP